MPYEHEFLLKGRLSNEVLKELSEKGRQHGFWALDVPEEYGGQPPHSAGSFKVPTIVEMRDSLPKTSIGKIEKNVLRHESADRGQPA